MGDTHFGGLVLSEGLTVTGDTHLGELVTSGGLKIGTSASSTLAFSNVYVGSATWDAASILDGDEEAKDITVTGAALGDFCLVSLSVDVVDLVLNGQVTAADTVTAVLANNTGASVDLASATVRAIVFSRG